MSDDYYSIDRTDDPERPGTARFRLRGTLDIGAREDLQDAFREALDDPGVDAIEVHLGRVTFLDSEALAGLIMGYTEAGRSGRGFAVVGAQGLVKRVLTVTGTLALFGGQPPSGRARPGQATPVTVPSSPVT